jgi:hypothetical protein
MKKLNDKEDFERILNDSKKISENYHNNDDFRQYTQAIIKKVVDQLRLELQINKNDGLFQLYDDVFNYCVNNEIQINYNLHQNFIIDYKDYLLKKEGEKDANCNINGS